MSSIFAQDKYDLFGQFSIPNCTHSNPKSTVKTKGAVTRKEIARGNFYEIARDSPGLKTGLRYTKKDTPR